MAKKTVTETPEETPAEFNNVVETILTGFEYAPSFITSTGNEHPDSAPQLNIWHLNGKTMIAPIKAGHPDEGKAWVFDGMHEISAMVEWYNGRFEQ